MTIATALRVPVTRSDRRNPRSVSELIDSLAAKHRDGDPVPLEIKSIACDCLTGDSLSRAWNEVLEAIAKRDSLINGIAHWSEVFDAEDVGWVERHENACYIASQDVEDAKAVLTGIGGSCNA